jgi:FkbM family methyltransferase
MKDTGHWNSSLEEKRYQYDNLNENSVVIDLGAYAGLWAHRIGNMYDCNVHAYEAVEEYYNNYLKDAYWNVIPYKLAVSCKTGTDMIHVCDEGSTLEDLAEYKRVHSTDHYYLDDLENKDKGLQEVNTIDINEVLEKFDVVHLLKMNIEGAEYDILDRMCDTGTINRVERLQIQFHKDVEDSEKRYDSICEELNKTHECYFDSMWRWSFWRDK